MRVVALYRVSTERQAEEGASLDAQQRKYHELAKAQGWQTVGEFRGCESATQAATERRVLQQVLSCIREHQPDAVYIHEQSRLTRGDELEVALLFRELRERGIKIIVGGVVRDLSSIDERFMVGIQSLVDRAEAERTKERSRRGKLEKARQGRKNSGMAPYGYRNPPPGDPKRGILQIVPEQAAVVRRIFELCTAGMSRADIRQQLNADKAPSSQGKQWEKTTIARILCNPVYIGTHLSNAWVHEQGKVGVQFRPDNSNIIMVEHAHEPIIDRALWEIVRRRLPAPSTKKPRMLTGMLHVNGVRCIGGTLRGTTCYGSRGQGAPWLRAHGLDESVWQAFVTLASGPDFVSAMMEEAAPRRSTKAVQAEMKQCESRLVKLRTKLERLVDMRAEGEISKDMYQRKAAEANEAIARTESDIRRLRGELAVTDHSRAEQVVTAVKALVGRHRLTDDERRRILRSIVRRIDLRAERTRHRQTRRNGSFARWTGAKWTIRDVGFTLSLPVGNPRDSHMDTSSLNLPLLSRTA